MTAGLFYPPGMWLRVTTLEPVDPTPALLAFGRELDARRPPTCGHPAQLYSWCAWSPASLLCGRCRGAALEAGPLDRCDACGAPSDSVAYVVRWPTVVLANLCPPCDNPGGSTTADPSEKGTK